jgi:hypothetical protein
MSEQADPHFFDFFPDSCTKPVAAAHTYPKRRPAMLRLTLRTLLSYLDDTLEPSEATALGAKLAESEQAQEIVERMRNVIRRRRLTVPPAASRMDPNTIAEYLDNEISPEQAEELERICLASDVHLAEVAACHQTLSIILGEPTEVPPDAIRRMIELGKGTTTVPKKSRTASPPAPVHAAGNAKPHAAHAATTTHSGRAEEESLPSLAGRSWLGRVAMLLGGAAACVLLGVAIHQLITAPPPTGPKPQLQVQADPPKPDPPKVSASKEEVIGVLPIPADAKPIDTKLPDAKVPDVKAPEAKVEPKVEPTPVAKVDPKTDDKTPPGGAVDLLPPPTFTTTVDPKIAGKVPDVPLTPPSAAVGPVGVMLEPAKDAPAVALQRLDKSGAWSRLLADGGKSPDVYSTRPLIALPGSRASFNLGGKVRLTLWGNVPEDKSPVAVVESLVELHAPEKIDVDLTLRRGRIVLTSTSENSNDPAGAETSWLVSLPTKGTKLLVECWGRIFRDDPFVRDPQSATRKGPRVFLSCVALDGTPMIKTATETAALTAVPGAAHVDWNSQRNKLETTALRELPPWFDAKTKPSAELTKLRKAFDAAFTGKASDLALTELMKSTDPLTRRTAVRCLGALDDLPGLVEVLNQDKAELRAVAVETLYCWIGASRTNDYRLFEMLKERLNETDAGVVMALLHGVPDAAAANPETYQALIANLVHPQMAVRELSRMNLYALAPAGANIPYDAADPTMRAAAHRRWQILIPPGKMPPTKKGA